MRIWGIEPSSVILIQKKKQSKGLKYDAWNNSKARGNGVKPTK